MSHQIELNFEPGLLERYEKWWDCVIASVGKSRRQQKAIAADMDMSQSEFTRKLHAGCNPNDQVHFPAERMDELLAILAKEGILDPILWLAEKYLADKESRRKAAAAELVSLVPKIKALVEAAS